MPADATVLVASKGDAELLKLDGRTAWHFPQTLEGVYAGAHPAVVAVDADEVIGFGSLSPYKDRAAYSTTVEDSVYVRRDRRRQGVGRLILDELLKLATTHGFHAVIARIVGDHDASIVLHERCGFTLVGVENEVGRKFGRWLDVVELQCLL